MYVLPLYLFQIKDDSMRTYAGLGLAFYLWFSIVSMSLYLYSYFGTRSSKGFLVMRRWLLSVCCVCVCVFLICSWIDLLKRPYVAVWSKTWSCKAYSCELLILFDPSIFVFLSFPTARTVSTDYWIDKIVIVVCSIITFRYLNSQQTRIHIALNFKYKKQDKRNCSTPPLAVTVSHKQKTFLTAPRSTNLPATPTTRWGKWVAEDSFICPELANTLDCRELRSYISRHFACFPVISSRLYCSLEIIQIIRIMRTPCMM